MLALRHGSSRTASRKPLSSPSEYLNAPASNSALHNQVKVGTNHTCPSNGEDADPALPGSGERIARIAQASDRAASTTGIEEMPYTGAPPVGRARRARTSAALGSVLQQSFVYGLALSARSEVVSVAAFLLDTAQASFGNMKAAGRQGRRQGGRERHTRGSYTGRWHDSLAVVFAQSSRQLVRNYTKYSHTLPQWSSPSRLVPSLAPPRCPASCCRGPRVHAQSHVVEGGRGPPRDSASRLLLPGEASGPADPASATVPSASLHQVQVYRDSG